MYSTALLPQNSAQVGGDVAISGWMPIGGNMPIPIAGGQFHNTATIPIPTLGYQYPIVANSVPTIPAAPINMGAAVSGNNFYSVWPPDKSKTYGVIDCMHIFFNKIFIRDLGKISSEIPFSGRDIVLRETRSYPLPDQS